MESRSRLLHDLFRLGINLSRHPRRSTTDAAVPHGGNAFYGSWSRHVFVDAFHRNPFAIMERMEGSNAAGSTDVSAGLRVLVLGRAANPLGDRSGNSGYDSSVHHAPGDYFPAHAGTRRAAREWFGRRNSGCGRAGKSMGIT